MALLDVPIVLEVPQPTRHALVTLAKGALGEDLPRVILLIGLDLRVHRTAATAGLVDLVSHVQVAGGHAADLFLMPSQPSQHHTQAAQCLLD